MKYLVNLMKYDDYLNSEDFIDFKKDREENLKMIDEILKMPEEYKEPKKVKVTHISQQSLNKNMKKEKERDFAKEKENKRKILNDSSNKNKILIKQKEKLKLTKPNKVLIKTTKSIQPNNHPSLNTNQNQNFNQNNKISNINKEIYPPQPLIIKQNLYLAKKLTDLSKNVSNLEKNNKHLQHILNSACSVNNTGLINKILKSVTESLYVNWDEVINLLIDELIEEEVN